MEFCKRLWISNSAGNRRRWRNAWRIASRRESIFSSKRALGWGRVWRIWCRRFCMPACASAPVWSRPTPSACRSSCWKRIFRLCERFWLGYPDSRSGRISNALCWWGGRITCARTVCTALEADKPNFSKRVRGRSWKESSSGSTRTRSRESGKRCPHFPRLEFGTWSMRIHPFVRASAVLPSPAATGKPGQGWKARTWWL